MTTNDPVERMQQLAQESVTSDDPTGWFERLYSDARSGEAFVPWERTTPHRLLADWALKNQLTGTGKTALVVGCGFGEDSEFTSSLGFATVGFDIAPSGIRAAQERYPDSAVDYLVANLLDPPSKWSSSFDLVIEIFTVQALPVSLRRLSAANVGAFVAPGGTLFVVAFADEGLELPFQGPPWPFSRSEIDYFAASGLDAISIELVVDVTNPGSFRWQAEFSRPLT